MNAQRIVAGYASRLLATCEMVKLKSIVQVQVRLQWIALTMIEGIQREENCPRRILSAHNAKHAAIFFDAFVRRQDIRPVVQAYGHSQERTEASSEQCSSTLLKKL